MSSGLKRTGRRSDATPFAGGRLPQFATVRQLDLDAARYLAAVEAADGARLEPAVRAAVNAFVVGCKADSIWTPIKACCILAGASTLSGALVPLVGTAPTNFNFVSGDYNRKTGLAGNGTTKYLNANRNNNADPQNSRHLAVWIHSAHTANGSAGQYIGSTDGDGFSLMGRSSINANCFVSISSSASTVANVGASTGLMIANRSSISSYIFRVAGSDNTISVSSSSPASGDIYIFRRPSPGTAEYTTARLAFYSIGESIDQSKYDIRVTTLITTIGAAIP